MLGNCRECGREISTNAAFCPQCGQPDPFFSEMIGKFHEELPKKALKAYGQQEITCPTCKGTGCLYRYVERRYHELDTDNSRVQVHTSYWSNRDDIEPERFGRYRNTVKCGSCKGRGVITRSSLQYTAGRPSPWID